MTDSAEDFRNQLTGQLEQLRYGNADVEGTVTYIMDLIGGTKLVAVDAVMAEEVRKLRIENGHLQYVISTTAQPSKPVEEVCPTCKGLGLTGWDKPIGSPPSMACVPQFCFCEKGRSLAGFNAPDAKRTIVSSISGFEGAPPSATDDEQVMREMVDYMISNQSMTAKQLSRGIIKIISRIRAEERERCARIAEATYTVDGNDSMSEVDRWVAGNGIAAAIRTGDK